jgi:signal transduction histidine kinase
VLGKERVAAVPTESEQALSEAESLITHLQVTTEAEKAKLARKLHDELGGLMVSALMDLGSVQQLQNDITGPARRRLDRAKGTLEAAIDLKRRVIEELRPSILDNFGLFAALRWHLRRLCEGSSIDCADHYPDIEPQLEPDMSVALKRGSVTSTELHVQVDDGTLSMSVSDNGTPILASEGHEVGASTAIASMRHRIRELGGKVDMRRTDSGGTVFTASMPLRARSNP